MRKHLSLQIKILLLLILANFIAQVPYFFHLYYRTQAFSTTLRSFLIMGVVFAFFLAASILFLRRQRLGYLLLLSFLSVEFLFYFLGTIQSALHGYGWFFQIHNPDLTLRIIYSIGYLNLFASGYFIFLLLAYRESFRTDLLGMNSSPA